MANLERLQITNSLIYNLRETGKYWHGVPQMENETMISITVVGRPADEESRIAHEVLKRINNYDKLVAALAKITHATQPGNDDAYHENAYQIAIDALVDIQDDANVTLSELNK